MLKKSPQLPWRAIQRYCQWAEVEVNQLIFVAWISAKAQNNQTLNTKMLLKWSELEMAAFEGLSVIWEEGKHNLDAHWQNECNGMWVAELNGFEAKFPCHLKARISLVFVGWKWVSRLDKATSAMDLPQTGFLCYECMVENGWISSTGNLLVYI